MAKKKRKETSGAEAAQPPATRSKVRRSARSRYIPALDGLRAFAVLAVIFYHMGLGWAPGGLMGVTVFFVISGYLINGLLVAEYERTGTVSLSRFWLRRVRRIVPAVLLAIAGTVALCALMNPALLDKARPDIVPSLLFFNNWWQIFHDLSYFEASGAPSPLTHYWSLAIEEQFYIVWPLLLIGMFAVGLKKRHVGGIALVLAVLSAVEMALLYDPTGDPSRAYYGTDTRAMSLLVGVWLAIAWPSAAFGQQRANRASRPVWLAFNAVGVACLVGLVVIVAFTNGYSAFPYRGGIALTSVLAAVLIAVMVVPGTWVARFFQLEPLVWVGKRSYGMYLWHYPIVLLTSRLGTTVEVPWWVRLSQLIVIFAVAELSYRFVEDPIRRGKLGDWWRARKGPGRVSVGVRMRRAATALVVAAVFAAAFVGCVVVQPVSPEHAQDPPETGAVGLVAAKAAEKLAESPLPDQELLRQTVATVQNQVYENAPLKRVVTTVRQVAADEKRRIQDEAYAAEIETPHEAGGQPLFTPLLIGDSVSAGCVDEFYRVFPNGHIDAVVNRNIWESPYAAYADAGQVGDYVVFCLGTNNTLEDWQVDEMLAPVAADKKVVLVNIRAPRDWETQTNNALASAAERYSNVVALVDWYAASAGHDEYFYDDGIHLTNTGPQAYIGLIRDAIQHSVDHDAVQALLADRAQG